MVQDLSIPTAYVSQIASIMCLFALFGPFISKVLLSKFNYRFVVRFLTGVAIISWLFLLFASEKTFYFALINRALLGISSGGFSSILPEYISLISTTKEKDGILHEVGISLGPFFCNLLGSFITWRIQSIVWLLTSIFMFFSLNSVPQKEKIQSSYSNESVFSYRKLLIVCFFYMFFQQFSGINAIQANISSILENNLQAAFACLAKAISPMISYYLVEKVGLRLSYSISSLFACLSLFLVRFVSQSSYALVFLIYLFGFGLGLGPVPWVIPTLSFPESVRSSALSMLASSNWILSYIVVSLYIPLTQTIDKVSIFSMFGLINFIGMLFGYYFYPIEIARPLRISDESPLLL